MKNLFKKLPLLDYADTLFDDVDLSNVLIIGVRHLLQSHYIFFRYLEKRGLNPKNVYLIGKAYTTNQTVVEAYKKRGYNISKHSSSFNSHETFDQQFNEYIDRFIDEINSKIKGRKFDQVVVLDDGGMILNRIQKLSIKNIVAVEQTSAGYNLLSKTKLPFPILNVARSKAKLIRETPHVIGVFMKEFKRKVDLSKKYKILIIGGGYIGKEAARQLKEIGQASKLYDIVPNRSQFKEKNLNRIIPLFDLIIGTTGKESLNKQHLKFAERGTLLISLSSSDREFPSQFIRSQFPQNSDPYLDYEFNGVKLLNAGFPMTFVGQVQPMPLKYMQITSSMLYSSILYGVSKKIRRKGFVSVPNEIQDQLISKFKKLRHET